MLRPLVQSDSISRRDTRQAGRKGQRNVENPSRIATQVEKHAEPRLQPRAFRYLVRTLNTAATMSDRSIDVPRPRSAERCPRFVPAAAHVSTSSQSPILEQPGSFRLTLRPEPQCWDQAPAACHTGRSSQSVGNPMASLCSSDRVRMSALTLPGKVVSEL